MNKTYARKGTVRALTKADIPAFRDHLFRLDPDSRRNRFLGIINDDYLQQYPERCCDNGATVIAYVEDGVVHGVAELHPTDTDTPTPTTAEVAFSVEPDYRRRGIGTELFGRILANARERGIEALRMNCHPQNHAMQALARKFSTDITIDRSGTIGWLRTKPAHPPAPELAVHDGRR